ncbi:MAG: TonB-dependent receptor [Gammaproteobacteria bacterium]|nr:TonB-dependent receptor [Gammaproteobacteria bacterium]
MHYSVICIPISVILALNSLFVRAEDAQEPVPHQLEPVIVEGATGEDQTIDIPLGWSFDGRALQEVPGSADDALRSIQALPGVAVNNDWQSGVAIRGSRPENNQFFIDFMPVGYLFHFGGKSVIDGDLVERFDLYPAGYGAQFQGGIGGVIDLTTRAPDQDQTRALLDVNFLDAGFLLEGPVSETQSGFLSLRYSYYDLIVKDFIDDDDEDVEIVQLPKYFDYRGKYRIGLDGDAHLDLYLDGADDQAEFIMKDDSDEVLKDPLLAGGYLFDRNYHRQGAVFEKALDGDRGYRLGLAHIGQRSSVRVGQVGSGVTDLDTYTLRTQLALPRWGLQQWEIGAEYNRFQVDYQARFYDPGCTEFDVDCRYSDAELVSSAGRLTVNQAALYVQDRLQLTDRWVLTPGLGINGEDYLHEVKLEPRIRLDFQYDPFINFSMAAGRYHQFPEFAQVEKEFGNPDLEYQQSDHYVMGVEQILGAGWEWKVEAYYKTFDSLVTSDESTRYSNHGDGKARGLELFLQKSLTDRFSGWLAVSYSRSERRDSRTGETFDFEYDQPLIISAVSKYRFNDRYALSGKFWYHSGAPYTPILGGEEDPENPGSYKPVYGEINSERLPDYYRLDIRFDYTPVSLEGLVLYAELINATNHQNVSGYDYSPDYTERDEVTQLPVFLSFGVKKEWQ